MSSPFPEHWRLSQHELCTVTSSGDLHAENVRTANGKPWEAVGDTDSKHTDLDTEIPIDEQIEWIHIEREPNNMQ